MTKEKKKVEVQKKTEGRSKDLQEKRDFPTVFFESVDNMFDNIRGEFFTPGWEAFRKHLLPYGAKATLPVQSMRRPLTNITSDEKNYYLSTEVPGLDKKEIDISIKNGQLKISGEAEMSEEELDEEVIRKEYYSTKFYRAYNLPENIQEDKIEASLDKGILKITVPKEKTEESEERKIKVK